MKMTLTALIFFSTSAYASANSFASFASASSAPALVALGRMSMQLVGRLLSAAAPRSWVTISHEQGAAQAAL